MTTVFNYVLLTSFLCAHFISRTMHLHTQIQKCISKFVFFSRKHGSQTASTFYIQREQMQGNVARKTSS